MPVLLNAGPIALAHTLLRPMDILQPILMRPETRLFLMLRSDIAKEERGKLRAGFNSAKNSLY